MADKIVVMKKGCIEEQGNREQLQKTQSAYTRALLGAVPSLEGERYV